jgi:transcriptional regulator with XRE-family HTH domain
MENENKKELKRLGALLRDFRKKKNLTLYKLSKQAQFSIGYLSQIERGMTSPTISAFKKIASVLGVNLMYFFDGGNSNTSYVVRHGQRKTISNPKAKVIYELLKPAGFMGILEPLLVRFLPGAKSEKSGYTHLGEECLYILKGGLKFYLDGKAYDLQEGDSIWYPSVVKHRWENPYKEITLAIRVTTPPSF